MLKVKRHIAKNIIIALLLFAGISSLLSLVVQRPPSFLQEKQSDNGFG